MHKIWTGFTQAGLSDPCLVTSGNETELNREIIIFSHILQNYQRRLKKTP